MILEHDKTKVQIAVKSKWTETLYISFVLVHKFILVSLSISLQHKSPKNVLLMHLINGRMSVHWAP